MRSLIITNTSNVIYYPPGGIRTHTSMILNHCLLPVGLREETMTFRIRTETDHALNVMPLPVGLMSHYAKEGIRTPSLMILSHLRVPVSPPQLNASERIRTFGWLPINGFQDRFHKPLGHTGGLAIYIRVRTPGTNHFIKLRSAFLFPIVRTVANCWRRILT